MTHDQRGRRRILPSQPFPSSSTLPDSHAPEQSGQEPSSHGPGSSSNPESKADSDSSMESGSSLVTPLSVEVPSTPSPDTGSVQNSSVNDPKTKRKTTSRLPEDVTREWYENQDSSDSQGFFEETQGESDSDSLEVPEQLGDYRVQRLIGSGGMGQVFLAEHIRMQRTVALKTLPIQRLDDNRAIDRFFDEVRAASRVLHPNIVTAFDAGEQDGVPYLAMEYVDGATLTAIVSQNGPLPVGEAASVIRQAALGLLHAHRAGLVHRDVKPGNLMRASDGTIKVLDLGLARISHLTAEQSTPKNESTSVEIQDAASAPPSDSVSEELSASSIATAPTPSPDGSDLADPSSESAASGKTARPRGKKKRGRLIGTLSFMSPEQLEDPESVDSRSDIYSLGATLFFLLTARPPFGGEFLDQVYGHRHGEIPDLMELRDDVDLNFANVFRRMLAKSPSERYNSLDEVVDDLAGYADAHSAPHWLSELTRSTLTSESSTMTGGSTFGGESTVIRRTQVVGLDLGMFETAAASCDINGELRDLTAGESEQPLFRMILSSDEDGLQFGPSAMAKRADRPDQVVHCVSMYIGQKVVEREVAQRQCPPEVLLGAMIRRCMQLAWKRKLPPEAVAITVPSVYDQLHRRSVLQAATIAGLKSVRLVDRSLAAIQVMLGAPEGSHGLVEEDMSVMENPLSSLPAPLDPDRHRHVLFVGLTGQANEAAMVRHEHGRLQQLGTGGHWNQGTLPWIQRLVDVTAEAFKQSIDLDPRLTLRRASRLQIACERAVQTFVMLPTARLSILAGGRQVSVDVQRDAWLERCEDLIQLTSGNIRRACQRSGIQREEIDLCVGLGPLLRIPQIQQRIFAGLNPQTTIRVIDRNEVACGAAACLAAELPGRGDIAMPPRNVSSHQIGIVVEDAQGRSRILPIIPRGTILPARTNRRISASESKRKLTLSLVESSGPHGEDWQSLGRYEFDLDDQVAGSKLSRLIGFEIDVNGLLTVRAQTPGVAGSVKLRPLPEPAVPESDVPGWAEWLSEQRTS